MGKICNIYFQFDLEKLSDREAEEKRRSEEEKLQTGV